MTYLQRTAGTLLDETFNFNTKHYVGHYLDTPKGQSILYYCSHFNYTKVHELEISPSAELTFREISPGYYEITYNGDSPQLVQISLTAL